MLPCGHIFGAACLHETISSTKADSCLLCRQVFKEKASESPSRRKPEDVVDFYLYVDPEEYFLLGLRWILLLSVIPLIMAFELLDLGDRFRKTNDWWFWLLKTVFIFFPLLCIATPIYYCFVVCVWMPTTIFYVLCLSFLRFSRRAMKVGSVRFR